MKIEIPELSLVALVGASGSGKSTFAAEHFKPTEVLSSDRCRGWVADDEADQAASADAFDVLYYIADKRLSAGRLTVIDATNVQASSRARVVKLAKEQDVLPVAIVLKTPERVCLDRNKDRGIPQHAVHQQSSELRRSLRSLKREGFCYIWVLSPEEVAATTIRRVPMWPNKKDERGPFDIIGDVHGCFEELLALLIKLGYTVDPSEEAPSASHPAGRRAIFLGDLVDRGPKSPAVLRLVMQMVGSGAALCVPGNHDVRLKRKLEGRKLSLTHGLAETMAQLEGEPQDFLQELQAFIDGLVSHLVLDEGKLVVAHAGMKQAYQGRASRRVREFALYGETTGETDSYGLPVRHNWANEYRGPAMVVYGHTPVPTPEWQNRSLCVDTGCVFGGALTALRYPERELVSEPARKVYCEPAKPLIEPEPAPKAPRPLDIQDVQGARVIKTRLRPKIGVRAESAAAAIEVMSRFSIDPRWLIYLPPTMSPSATCDTGPLLEHPEACFSYFEHRDVKQVVCQEKHMGSRVVVVVCRDEAAAARRFGIEGFGAGALYTRTGRAFFTDPAAQAYLLDRLREALSAAGFWERFDTDWFCIDAELMPWSAKAQELLKTQYAPVGATAKASLTAARDAIARAAARTEGMQDMLARYQARADCAERYTEAYRRYCWTVSGLDDYRLAPFHLLASEGAVHTDKDHLWHMQTLAELCAVGAPLLKATAHRVVELGDAESRADGIRWWEELTAGGGEGMVVKPIDWIGTSRKGLIQPALKCRGAEYLRIIYGPEYTMPENLERLRARGLSRKRALAVKEFSLGIEALERFVGGEPLYRVHECVFGVLAMETDPVDPRL